MQNKPIAKNVDEYLKKVPAVQRKALQNLREAIKEAAPQATEGIGYGMPYYKYCGRLLYFAAFKDHLSFFPADKATITKFKPLLKKFKTSAGTIQFTPERPIPATLVKEIVKWRIVKNEAKKKQ